MRISASILLMALAACSSSSPRNVRLTPEEERVLRPMPESSERVRGLVADGDALFFEGIPSYRRSDPDANADWAAHVDEALRCFTKARSSYLAAQGNYASPAPVPPPLLDRIRECVQRIALLQRRQHAAGQK